MHFCFIEWLTNYFNKYCIASVFCRLRCKEFIVYTVLATGTDFLSFLLVRSHQLVNMLCASQLQGILHNAYCYNPGEYSWERNWPLIAWILACELKCTSELFSLVFAQFESNNQNLSFSPRFTCFTPCENLQGPVDNSTLANRTLACSKHPDSRRVSYSTSSCICVVKQG